MPATDRPWPVTCASRSVWPPPTPATAPGHGRTAEELTHAADVALLDVKGRGKHRFSIAA